MFRHPAGVATIYCSFSKNGGDLLLLLLLNGAFTCLISGMKHGCQTHYNMLSGMLSTTHALISRRVDKKDAGVMVSSTYSVEILDYLFFKLTCASKWSSIRCVCIFFVVNFILRCKNFGYKRVCYFCPVKNINFWLSDITETDYHSNVETRRCI